MNIMLAILFFPFLWIVVFYYSILKQDKDKKITKWGNNGSGRLPIMVKTTAPFNEINFGGGGGGDGEYFASGTIGNDNPFFSCGNAGEYTWFRISMNDNMENKS
jgi:hypothetical protein